MIGNRIEQFPVLGSTNNYIAKELNDGNYEFGTVILAHYQTEGKGQLGSKWESESGKNLTFSFAIECEYLPVTKKFVLAKAISLGIYKCLSTILPAKVEIKWPNDLLVSGKKICGILIENRIGAREYSICGIGLNVNQEVFPGLEATSLRKETGKFFSSIGLLEQLISFIDEELIRSKADRERLNTEYRNHLFGMGREVGIRTGDKTYNGRIKAVSDHGLIAIADEGGNLHEYQAKTVEILY